ncbi:hypothetical protein [Halobacteriovorax sp. JY17]|uniref:hypothetical protein n=1 Tax=Halobacteriovorax sp. JY17 TaxID=2014617 RepID=UPI000C6B3C91|nr:hypothetical protein [Halobacteriovorax sp. JY17]PIK15965.1 MAG: hypothetical protein CES88_04345 [Halobacteriovorax sp. JY17]
MLLKLFLLLFIVSMNSFAGIDELKTPEVAQREYIYTNSEVNESIQTVGVYTCVALVVRDRGGNGALAHFDAATDIDRGVSEVLSNFSDLSELEVSLFGGQSPYRLEEEIKEKLLEYGLTPDRILRNTTSKASMNINVNLKTGIISDYTERFSNTSYSTRKFKSDRLKFSKRLYRHEKSIGGGDYIPAEDESEFGFEGFRFDM